MPFAVNDRVHVPSLKAGLAADYPYSMASVTIREVADRHVKVSLPNGDISEDIPLSLVRKRLGLLIVQIGDFESEATLLEPLKKSILQFARLLLNDDYIRSYSVRSAQEFRYVWEKEHPVTSHIILVGHGDATSIRFGPEAQVPADDFIELISTDDGVVEAKQIISLCCKTGSKSFGGNVSGTPNVEAFIGPTTALHGANASQFCQSYLTYHFLHGYKSSTAYEYARATNPGASDFTFWRKTKAWNALTPLKIVRVAANG
jgi:hypothetical protein